MPPLDDVRKHAPNERRNALIAGGSSGVGLACARALLTARTVDRVALAGRDVRRLDQAVESLLQRFGDGTVVGIAGDVGTVGGATHAAIQVDEMWGGVDLAICSTVPSDVSPELLAKVPIDAIEKVLTGITLPPLLLTKALIPSMRERGGGSIVLVASDAAKVSTPGETVIGAAMSAITMFTRAAALELKRDGIRLNCVTPSLIADTPTSARVLASGFSAKLFTKAAEQAALGVPDAADVAELVCHLAGPSSSRVTGQVVSINGGISTG